jgi:hypothetical protein
MTLPANHGWSIERGASAGVVGAAAAFGKALRENAEQQQLLLKALSANAEQNG